MGPVRFAISRRQSRGLLAIIIGCVVLVDAVMIYVLFTAQRGPTSPTNLTWVLFTAGLDVVVLAIGLPVYVMYALGWTELSQSGIKTRRLGRTRLIPWDQVRDIKVRTKNGASEIVVITTDARVLLSAPTTNMVVTNRRFPEELAQIRGYWGAVGSQLR
jgi:Bacterial PH domain